MSTNVYDLSDFDDDIDLSMFEDAGGVNSGSVFWQEGTSSQKLFDYEVEDESASLHLTDLGQKLFRTPVKEIGNVDEMTFAHYLGLQAENKKDLDKRIENATGLPYTSHDGVLDAARKDSCFAIKGADEGVSHQPSRGPSKGQIVANDLSDLESKCLTNTFRHGGRSVASVFRDNGSSLDPMIVKYTSDSSSQAYKTEEGRMMAFEHAALKALRKHGISAVSSELVSSPNGGTYLVTGRFDGQSFSKQGVSEPYKMFSPMSWANTVEGGKFSPLSTDMASAKMLKISNKDAISTQVMTRYMFDKLIGNVDSHGFNVGTITEVDGGNVKRKLAPAFDVTPYLMGQNGSVARDFGLGGVTLSQVGLKELASRDPLLQELITVKPEMAESAFKKASAIRESMVHIVEDELVRGGHISKTDASMFKQYLETPLASGGDNPELSTASPNGLFERRETAIHAFKQKALDGRQFENQGREFMN